MRAVVEPFDGDWYTQAKKETETSIEEPLRVERRLGLELSFGRVSVTEQVVAYQKKAVADGSTLETVPLDLPPTTFDTEAVWFVPRPHQLDGLEAMPLLLSSLHAAEHSLIALLPLWAMCDRWDIGGLSTNLHLDTGAPTVFVYDGHAGGVGIAERGFDRFEGWVADTVRLLEGCPCEKRLPVLRPEPEVRQPQRVPRQRRRPDTFDEDVEFRLTHSSYRRQPTPEEEPMQYLLLIHDDEAQWGDMPEDERNAVYAEYGQYTQELQTRGILVGADRSSPPRRRPSSTSRTARP